MDDVKNAWHALTAVLALKKETKFDDVNAHLRNTPKPHVMAVQFIIRGAGYSTLNLDVDGDWGNESELSLGALYVAAHAFAADETIEAAATTIPIGECGIAQVGETADGEAAGGVFRL